MPSIPRAHQLRLDGLFANSKRWRDRRPRWTPSRESIDPREYGVDLIDRGTARPYVEQHHYAHSYPAEEVACGLFRKTGVAPSVLVGVAVFAQTSQPNAITCHLGIEPDAGLELSRFVLDEQVLGNGESFFLRHAFAIVRDQTPHIRRILSYADPSITDLHGRRHFGIIYQAHNAVFAGTSEPRIVTVAPDGHVINDRGLSKVRNNERGRDYVIRELLAAGAEPRRRGESPRDWIYRVIRQPPLRRIKQKGKLVYTFGLNKREKRGLLAHHAGGLPYPKPPATESPS
jgi:hypothetical protein